MHGGNLDILKVLQIPSSGLVRRKISKIKLQNHECIVNDRVSLFLGT